MNRKQFIGGSLLSLLASRLFADTINFEKNMADITINICKDKSLVYYFDFSTDTVTAWNSITGNAGWISILQDGETSSAIGISIDAQNTSMSDTFEVTVKEATSIGETLNTYSVTINVLGVCETASNVCCTNSEQIVWLNRDGGLQNFYFDGVREFNIDQRDDEEYIDSGNASRYSTSGKVKDGRIFSTKNITKTELNALDSLNYSIQAWHLSDSKYLPISISKGGYTKYNSRDKRFNASIRFTYSTPINIQTQ